MIKSINKLLNEEQKLSHSSKWARNFIIIIIKNNFKLTKN